LKAYVKIFFVTFSLLAAIKEKDESALLE